MHGNTPFGGNPTTTPAGQRSPEDIVTLTGDEKRDFKQNLQDVEVAAGRHLPNTYTVSSGLTQTPNGVRGLIIVVPPVGQPIGTSIIPQTAGGEFVPIEERTDIAQDVVATAVTVTISRTNDEPPTIAR